MNPKVTIIIPVFKAEKDIAQCCKALFAQTLDSIEYIFVDDCTPDRSVNVIIQTLREYPNRQSAVQILHQPHNSGVSACRQLGLNHATGEYVIHCDSDDWPDFNMYETLYETAIQWNAEVVCCDYVVEYGDRAEVVRFPDKYNERPSFNICPIEGAVWNKLISRKLIDRSGAEFYQGVNLGEDFGFVTPCRVMSRKNVVVHKPMYHYNQLNSNSITHNYTKERFMQVIYMVKKTENFMRKKGLASNFFFELSYLKFQAKAYFLMFPEIRDISLWKQTFPESNNYIWRYNSPMYLRFTAWLISKRIIWLPQIVLKLRDIISNRSFYGLFNPPSS